MRTILKTLIVPLTVASSPVFAATLITNGGLGTVGPITPSYGSNVTSSDANFTVSEGVTGVIGTPNIALNFISLSGSKKWDPYQNWNGRGTVIQFEEYDAGVGGELPLTFTPESGWAVRLNSVDFDEWAGGGAGVVNWAITGSLSGALANGTWNGSNAGLRSNVPFNVTGAIDETLTLTVDVIAGSGSYFAIDNLSFDQVPEPSTALIAAAGIGAMAMRRRRSK